MSLSERPPLDAYICEKIDAELHRIDEFHWPKITAMRGKAYYSPNEPVPPQQPQHLLQEIEWYGERLFKVEADYYDSFRNDERYGNWLSALASRVTSRVMKNLDILENSDTSAIHGLFGVRGGLILGYHGLTMPRIEEKLLLALAEQRRKYEQGISDSQRGAALFSSATKDAYAKAGIDLSSAPPLVKMIHAAHVVAQGVTTETSAKDALKAERKSLLDSYREDFPDVKLADVMWAAKQTRREWTRWIGYALLLLLLVLRKLEHIPFWFFCTMMGALVFWYLCNLIGKSLIELSQEIEKTNARIELLENSLMEQFYAISRRLPDKDA